MAKFLAQKNIAQKALRTKNKAINQNITEPLQNRQDSYTPPQRWRARMNPWNTSLC